MEILSIFLPTTTSHLQSAFSLNYNIDNHAYFFNQGF